MYTFCQSSRTKFYVTDLLILSLDGNLSYIINSTYVQNNVFFNTFLDTRNSANIWLPSGSTYVDFRHAQDWQLHHS